MKKLLYFSSLLAILFVSSCSKDDDGVADPAGEVAGTYQITSIEIDGDTYALSKDGISGTVKLNRKDAVSVDLIIALRESPNSTPEEFKTVALVTKSGSRVSLKFQDDNGYSDKGYVEDKKVYLDFYDGAHVKIEAKK